MREATATINLGAIRRNLERIRRLVGRSRVLAVVKADGYGHGLERVASALRAADGYGVASLEDATRIRQLEVRQGWPRKVIVLLSGISEPRDLPLLDSLAISCVVHDEEQLRLLELDRNTASLAAGLWLKLDTGMHRLGFGLEQIGELRRRTANLLHEGQSPVWITHFASADERSSDLTSQQIQRFHIALRGVAGPQSMANSAGVIEYPQSHADWVRPGGLLYGLSSFDNRTGADCGFEPAMTLSSRIIAIKSVAAGEMIGYGESERLTRNTRLGIVSIGYGDGYPRHASGMGATVMVDGQRARLLGRVSMDLTCVDLTDLPGVQVGSGVLMWGPDLPAEEVACRAQTISYELTCGITRRVAVREIDL